jgi:hypothetical protein
LVVTLLSKDLLVRGSRTLILWFGSVEPFSTILLVSLWRVNVHPFSGSENPEPVSKEKH